MATSWIRTKIKEFATVIGGGTPSKKVADYFEGDIPWITPKDLSGYRSRYICRGVTNITELGLRKSSAKMLPKGAILFSSRAPIGYIAIANNPITTNQGFRSIVCNESLASINFVYYAMLYNTSAIKAISSGSTFKEITGTALGNFEISLPPLRDQKKIGTILSSYDDLVENNLRRIKILEEMAQSLYCEWFVHFRFPGHEKVRFVDSPLGKIPEGWDVAKLEDILELNYGKGLPKRNRCKGSVPVYGSSGLVDHHDTSIVKGPGIIVGRKGNVGSVFWCDVDFFPIDTVYYVSSELPLRFLFYDLQIKNFINTDAAVPGLNRQQAYSLLMILPPKDLLHRFCDVVEDYGKTSTILRKQNRVLRQTRDLLISKLISGELDVSDLEIAISEEA